MFFVYIFGGEKIEHKNVIFYEALSRFLQTFSLFMPKSLCYKLNIYLYFTVTISFQYCCSRSYMQKTDLIKAIVTLQKFLKYVTKNYIVF